MARPQTTEDVVKEMLSPPRRGLIARGLGRSYGDAAQCAGGVVIDMRGHDRICSFDSDRGVIVVQAGVIFDALLRTTIPKGWFVPVSPGTRHVTIGGAIASDVHGKNHHVAGTIAKHVQSLTLLDGQGRVRAVDSSSQPEVYWATCGGMGLTGIILEASMRLEAIETASMVVDTERVSCLDDLLERMTSTDDSYTYSVAWIDCMAGGRALGRSVLTRGRHATLADLPERETRTALDFDPGIRLKIPSWLPASGLLNAATVAAFNELWFRRAPAKRLGELQTMSRFFYPLDGIAGWNRLYGAQGFVQYQLVVPFGSEDTVRTVLELVSRSGHPSFLAVFKRFGDANPGPLSFPMAGWSLALDFPVRKGLRDLLGDLDLLVTRGGGKVYLSKDSRLRPELLSQMYPRLDEWQEIRRRLDPGGIFVSDLSRRLNL